MLQGQPWEGAMNRNVINILAIIIIVLVVLFGARYFFGVDKTTPTANIVQSPAESTSPAMPIDSTYGEQN
jgi:hypothetical protein